MWYKNFQFKLFLFQIILTISILYIFADISLDRMANYTKSEIENRLNSNRVDLEEKIELNLDNIENIMFFLSNSNELSAKKMNEFDKIVQNTIKNTPIITQIYVMDINGMQTYKSSYTETLGDRSDRDYFKKAITGEKVFSDVLISRSTSEPIVVYACPIKSGNTVSGVLGCSINLKFLSSHLSYDQKDISVSKDMYGFIVDKEGNIIAHPKKEFIAEKLNVYYLKPVEEALLGKSGIGYYTFENTDKIVSFGNLKNYDWGVFVQVPEKTAFAGITLLKNMNIALILSLIILSIFVSYFVSKYLRKPIDNILNMISELENQRALITKKSTRDDEFGTIENAFISMANTVIDDQNKLEERIQKRTAELTNTMHELVVAQNKILLNQKMSALTQFISNLAHELNTPLGNALTSVTFTESTLDNILNSLENGNLNKKIFTAQMNDILNSVDITKNQLIKSRDLVHIITSLNIIEDTCTDETQCDSLVNYLKKYEFELTSVLYSTNHTLNIQTDISQTLILKYPDKIIQMLKILIENSKEHAFEKDFLGHIDINIEQKENSLYIRYSNNGKNIPQYDLDHIFEPFFKGNMGGSGRGLGLTIVYILVNQFFEGNVSCHNIESGGVKFEIEIPTSN